MKRIDTMSWVARYFGKSVEECTGYAKEQALIDYHLKWQSEPRKTDKQCREFYLDGEMAIYRQAWYRRESDWRYFTDKVMPCDRVLDYGCGIAQPLQCFIDKNPRPEITLADVPSSTFVFAKWRYGDKAKYVTIKNNRPPLKGKYDWIVFLDAIEHIPKAYKVFKHLFRHLKPGGNLIFWYGRKPASSHLAESIKENLPKVYRLLSKKARIHGRVFNKEHVSGEEWWIKNK